MKNPPIITSVFTEESSITSVFTEESSNFSGVHFSGALFVPSISTYNKVVSGYSITSNIPLRNLSWQFNLQRIWEKTVNGKGSLCDYETCSLPSCAFTILSIFYITIHLCFVNFGCCFCCLLFINYSRSPDVLI